MGTRLIISLQRVQCMARSQANFSLFTSGTWTNGGARTAWTITMCTTKCTGHEAKCHRVESARWIEDLKFAPDDPENVRCRLVVQQHKDFVRDHAHEGNAPLWTCRLLLSLAVPESPQVTREMGLCDAHWWYSFTLFSQTMRGFT